MRRQRVLTIKGGSSSIRLAVYELRDTLERRLEGKIDRTGGSVAKGLSVFGQGGDDAHSGQ